MKGVIERTVNAWYLVTWEQVGGSEKQDPLDSQVPFIE